MPVSDNENKEVVQEWFAKINPTTVVDIGPGKGTYAKLLHELSPVHTSWIGIEAWGPYINAYNLSDLYDEIIIGDVCYVDLDRVHPKPDLVIIGDVLEHLEVGDAQHLIRRLQTWCEDVIISIPLLHLEQEPYEGNWFEVHKDHWSHTQMMDFLGEGVVDSKKGDVLGYYWWNLVKSASWITGELR